MSDKNKITLWVIGDSTLSEFDDKYYYPRYGYGTKLSEYLDDGVEVVNLALSGRSSKSYTKEPEYEILFRQQKEADDSLPCMKKGDFLLIGFGHNDEKNEVERFTAGNGTYETEGSFAHSLYENYIKRAEAVGCTTILCTPIVRRSTDGEWKPEKLHITSKTGNFSGGDYPSAVRELGKTLDIPVVDMTQLTKALYDAMKPENTLYLHAWLSDNKVSVDNTHTNVWGARVNAYLCIKEIKKLKVSGISEHIINIEQESCDEFVGEGGDVFDIPSKDKYLVENKLYVPTVFNPDLKDSKLWQQCGIWKGTVFGDVFSKTLDDNFILEPAGDGAIHIAVRNNLGKISDVSDGIAMYYTKVAADKRFTFTAKVRVNDYFSSDWVSFGLMARDDMYIDEITSDTLGDYVAAAPLLLNRGDSAVNCFARKSGVLTYGGRCKYGCKPSDVLELKIESTNDGYACTFGREETIAGGFDFKLTAIDPENVYVGMFAARNADVTFYDIKLVVHD